jgi:hypothetical protein
MTDEIPLRDIHATLGNSHRVATMICLEYKPTTRSRKWRVAYRMHEAGRDNMKKDAPELCRQEGWHDWRIVTERII